MCHSGSKRLHHIIYVIHLDSNKEKADKKSRIRETKHFSTDADSSTDAIGGDGLG